MRKVVCALGICLVAGCFKQGEGTGNATPAPDPAPPAKLLVMATIAPMYCFAKNVAGDLADVQMIGSAPSAADLSHADLIVQNGFGFEKRLDQFVAQGLVDGSKRVLAARGTGPGVPGLPGDPNTPPGNAPPDFSGPPDPHVWLDPVMAVKEVQNIRDALMARDPKNADQYLANENQYEAKLRDLDDEVGRMTVDISKRRLVCPDATFSYFLSRYEFTVAQDPRDADAIVLATGTAPGKPNDKSLPTILLDPMETGPAAADFYEKTTLANAQALRQGLIR
jgi:ABC-type Zn uptake system ZnuABC Zn-binding protein ZnuA